MPPFFAELVTERIQVGVPTAAVPSHSMDQGLPQANVLT